MNDNRMFHRGRFATALLILAALAIPLLLPAGSTACVGRILYIGSLRSSSASVLSGLYSTIINERTGTTVKTKFFDRPEEIMAAMKAGEIDILIEYTGNALINVLGVLPEGDDGKAYITVKDAYQKQYGMVWLSPMSFSHPGGLVGKAAGTKVSAAPAPIIRLDILDQFPALPRVMQKLSGRLDLPALEALVKQVDGGEKPERAARDYLRKARLI